jgi:nucleoside-diphosphate-sugar epimerase
MVDRLLADGHEAVALDDLSTGRRANVAHLAADRRFRLIVADVADPLPDIGPVEVIYHLASPVTHYARRPLATLRTCAEGTRRVLDLARACGAVVVIASTSDIYGDPEVHPQVESYAGHTSPVGPRSSYVEGKRFAEALAMAARRERGQPVRVARIFNTYGPRVRPDDGRLPGDFIRRAIAGRPLVVHGTGEQTRSFCYVTDMVEALVRLAATDHDGPVNLGSPQEVSVLDLAREVLGLAGSASALEFAPRPEGDPSRRRPDITLARRLLGWQPAVPRREGLRLTIEACQQEEPGE